MARKNHALTYRPLRSGIAIWNPLAGGVGTLGTFGRASDNTIWLISCYHVLARPDPTAPFGGGEPIFQAEEHPAFAVATNSATRIDPNLDCAAAQLLPGIDTRNELLSVGELGLPVQPVQGMLVLKAGQDTEVTEGIVDSVFAAEITIKPPPGYPPKYDLTGRGDSGSLWIERDSRRPVAMHKAGNDTGPEVAFAINISSVFQALSLAPLP